MLEKIKNMFRRKNEYAVIEDLLENIPPLFRYKKTMSCAEMRDFVEGNAKSTKELLDAKGFPYTRDLREEKIALLQTEISELIDAFKKGKGSSDEGDELADIIIRLMNFPCLYPEILSYIDIESGTFFGIQENRISASLTGTTKEDSIVKSKFNITYTLFKTVCLMDDALINFESTFDKDERSIDNVVANFVGMIMLCKIYAEEILRVDLQDLINIKMKINHERPFRYNTVSELFE